MRHLPITLAALLFAPSPWADQAPAGAEPPAAMPAATTTVGPGDSLQPFTVENQFGEPATLDEQTRLLILAAGMQAGESASEVLEAAGDRCYRASGLIYVADISRMPRKIAERFAIPKMRENPVPVALARDGQVENIPRESDKVTLVELDDLTIDRVQLVDAPALKQAVQALCPDSVTSSR